MAKKISTNSGQQSKTPVFKRGNKMRRYDMIFDEDVQQTRAGFFKKDLYKVVEKSDDFTWTVEPGYEHRMDLISYKFYGTSKYDWVIEEINNIKDPIKDITIGTKLRMFSQSRMITMF